MSGKTIVNEGTLPVTESDSAAGEGVDVDQLINDAAEMGHTLPISDDIAPANLDWSELDNVKEFDRAAQQSVAEPAAPEPTQPVQEQAPVEQPAPREDVDLTDSMRKRIAGIKDKSATELAEKDALIAARDEQIAKLTQMGQDFQDLQEAYVPPTETEDSILQQINTLDTSLQEDGDAYTSAEVAQQMIRRGKLERQLDGAKRNAQDTQNLLKKQQILRQTSDQYVKDNYSFVSDTSSEYYAVLKDKAYPLLERMMGPNFKDHPNDMVMAAELTQMMVDSQKYQQLLGNTPAPRAEPAPMAGGTARAPTQRAPAQSSVRDQIVNARGGDINRFADILAQSGHSWRPNG